MNGIPRRKAAGLPVPAVVAALIALTTPARSFAMTREMEPITPIPAPPPAPPARIALGEQLFGDRRLSGDDSHNCASCHDLRSNGATRVSCDVNSSVP